MEMLLSESVWGDRYLRYSSEFRILSSCSDIGLGSAPDIEFAMP